MNFQEGEILLLNKEYEWTSFQLVNKVRYLICQNLHVKKLKVGHAGTLDPLASGLVVICTGKFTKKITAFQEMDKEYIASIKLGATTPSFDKETPEDFLFNTDHISRQQVEMVLRNMLGEQEQLPPQFSALKLKGKRAYEYARKGETVVLQRRPICIHEIELLRFSTEAIKIRVVCSKGTYIRSLARDIGLALQSGAYLTDLERTRIGRFYLDDAVTVKAFEETISNNTHTVQI